MARAEKRMINIHDAMVRELAEFETLFSDFKIVEVGEGEESNVVLVAKTPEEKEKLAQALAAAEKITD